MRVGVVVFNDEASPDAADTPIKPPPPSVTATAAPIAAQRERIRLFEPISFPILIIDACRRHHPTPEQYDQYSTKQNLAAKN